MHPLPVVKEPRVFEFSVQVHHAEKAGNHYDLRLGDPATGHAHSWALKYLPKPGEKRLAIQQPTHSIPYMDWSGNISQGYGKGDVELAQRNKAEVLKSSESAVRFNVYRGKEQDEYLLLRDKEEPKQWLIHNVTPSREVGMAKDLPSSKPPYKTLGIDKVDIEDPKTELQAKVDGANVLFSFRNPGATPRVFSYRPTERTTGIIEHTQKLPDFWKHRTSSTMKDTILRGELYAADGKGKALPAARVGGLLNAGVWKSREKQEQEGKLIPVVFDVVKWKGQNVQDAPYSYKRELLAKAVAAAPWLQRPRTATTPTAKRKLIEDIRTGKEPSTEEGVVEWHEDKAIPRKAKFTDEKDVYVRNVFPEAGIKRHGTMAGGFEYSHTKTGPIVGRVGTGMSHALKKDLLENPSAYVGLQAKIKALRAPSHYVPRAPAFLGFHLDQDLPEGIKMAGDIAGVADAKKTLMPGDILLTRSKSNTLKSKVFGKILEAFQGTPWVHAAMYAGNGNVIHARLGDGVMKLPLSKFHEMYDYQVYRVTKTTEAARQKAVATAQAAVGKSFDTPALLKTLVPRFLQPTEGKSEREAVRELPGFICSSLIAASYPHLHFGKRNVEATRPVDFARSSDTKLVAKTAGIKQALAERLIRLGATDIPKTPRLLMRHRNPQELAGLQHAVTQGLDKRVTQPLMNVAEHGLKHLPEKLQPGARKLTKFVAEDPVGTLAANLVPVPGAHPAYLAGKKGLERAIDRFAPLPIGG